MVEELKEALGKQCRALVDRKVYRVRARPEGKRIMSSKIIIGVKIDSQGYLKRVKCRYVPRGFASADRRESYIRRDSDMCSQEGLHMFLCKSLQAHKF